MAPDAPSPTPRRGWWRLFLAAAAVSAAADLPVLHTLLPVGDPLLLLFPALAACAVVGWWRGGSLPLAIGLVLLAGWQVFRASQSGVSSDMLSAGWAVVVGGTFGLVVLGATSRRFLPSGVMAVLAALLVSTVLIAVTPGGPAALRQVVATSVEVRGNADLVNWQNARAQMVRRSGTPADSATTAMLDRFEQTVAGLPAMATLVLPSALGLQTLAVLALAWAVFQRISRTRLGDALSPLREFRFSDQWVWSVIAGLVIALLPALEGLRPFGVNLLVFFGALYALRGAAVLAWFLRPGRSLLGLIVGLALLLLLRDGAAIALGLVGLGDTWADWRRRTRPAVS